MKQGLEHMDEDSTALPWETRHLWGLLDPVYMKGYKSGCDY